MVVHARCTAASTIDSPTENGNPARETGTQSQASPAEAPDYRRGEDFHWRSDVGNSSIRGSTMHVRSGVFRLLHPEFKAARIALAAGAVAGLAVLGACADGTIASKVAGP